MVNCVIEDKVIIVTVNIEEQNAFVPSRIPKSGY